MLCPCACCHQADPILPPASTPSFPMPQHADACRKVHSPARGVPSLGLLLPQPQPRSKGVGGQGRAASSHAVPDHAAPSAAKRRGSWEGRGWRSSQGSSSGGRRRWWGRRRGRGRGWPRPHCVFHRFGPAPTVQAGRKGGAGEVRAGLQNGQPVHVVPLAARCTR